MSKNQSSPEVISLSKDGYQLLNQIGREQGLYHIAENLTASVDVESMKKLRELASSRQNSHDSKGENILL